MNYLYSSKKSKKELEEIYHVQNRRMTSSLFKEDIQNRTNENSPLKEMDLDKLER